MRLAWDVVYSATTSWAGKGAAGHRVPTQVAGMCPSQVKMGVHRGPKKRSPKEDPTLVRGPLCSHVNSVEGSPQKARFGSRKLERSQMQMPVLCGLNLGPYPSVPRIVQLEKRALGPLCRKE